MPLYRKGNDLIWGDADGLIWVPSVVDPMVKRRCSSERGQVFQVLGPPCIKKRGDILLRLEYGP